MNLAPSEDEQMIRESADSLLADAASSAAVRAAMASATSSDAALWQRIASELGWCGIAIAEEHGGLGLGMPALVQVIEALGRHLACVPFVSHAGFAANLLTQMGSAAARAQWLPQLASGATTFTVPLSATPDWAATSSVLAATRDDGGGWRLKGHCARVPDVQVATHLLAFAKIEGSNQAALFALPLATPGVRIDTRNEWDLTRRFATVVLDNVHLSADARVDDDGSARSADGLARATALAQLVIAAEALGGAQACLDMTVAYTAQRKQFGRPVAGFQAVKHRCAAMMVRVEALRSMVCGAAALATEADEEDTLLRDCASAKAFAAETYFHCAADAIQLHGGVGFTWEYDPQLHFKRAQAMRHWLGTPEALREWVAKALLEARVDLTPINKDENPSPASGRGAGERARHHQAVADQGDEAFRAEVANWMREHLSGRFAALKHRGGPGDEDCNPALRKEWERELKSGGWTGVGWPREHGGRGLSIGQQVIFHEEYARAGGPGRMGHIGEGLIGPTLIQYGTDEQRARFLPAILSGTEFWAQGYSEPNAGSDLANVQTRAEQQADVSWSIDGQKIWTSLAQESDWVFIVARSEPGTRGSKGLSFLLLKLAQPGITIRPIRQMNGGAEFNEVFFDGAVAEAGHLVGIAGEGWKVAMALLEIERGVSTLGQQMHFAHEFELVIRAAKGNGAIMDPMIRQRLAEAWGGLRTMRYNALRMLAGNSLTLGREALIYKYFWSNWHRDLGKLAADVLGPAADERCDDPMIGALQRLFYFSRADTIYGGTNEIQLNLIAERGLGMPREARPVG